MQRAIVNNMVRNIQTSTQKRTPSIPNIIAKWPMNEGTGTSILNTAGGGFTGTINGATWTTPGYTGSGPVLSFDGVNDYVAFGDIFYYDVFTISLRFYTNINNATKELILKRNITGGVSAAGTSEYAVELISTGKLACTSWDSGQAVSQIFGATTVSTSAWHHAVWSKAGAGEVMTLYLNNIIDGTATQGNATLNTTNTLQLGARSASNDTRYWNGFIQDVRFYNRALTAIEVSAIYNGTDT